MDAKGLPKEKAFQKKGGLKDEEGGSRQIEE